MERAVGFACPELVPPTLPVPSANEGSEAEGSKVEGRSRRKLTELSRSIACEQVKKRKKEMERARGGVYLEFGRGKPTTPTLAVPVRS